MSNPKQTQGGLVPQNEAPDRRVFIVTKSGIHILCEAVLMQVLQPHLAKIETDLPAARACFSSMRGKPHKPLTYKEAFCGVTPEQLRKVANEGLVNQYTREIERANEWQNRYNGGLFDGQPPAKRNWLSGVWRF